MTSSKAKTVATKLPPSPVGLWRSLCLQFLQPNSGLDGSHRGLVSWRPEPHKARRVSNLTREVNQAALSHPGRRAAYPQRDNHYAI